MNIKSNKKCKNCRKNANYEEWSPDGPPYYFCSEKCRTEYTDKMRKKGIGWRAMPYLSKWNGEEFIYK